MAGDQIKIKDTARIIMEGSCSDNDPITAVIRITGTVQYLGENKSEHDKMWKSAAAIIEASVEYVQVKGMIDDQVIGEDPGHGVHHS